MTENKYTIEYASTGRAKCKDSKCKEIIEKGSLRIGKVAKNPFDDGGDTTLVQWYHARCFFEAQKRMRSSTKKVESESDLDGFDKLDAEVQNQVRDLISGRGEDVDFKKQEPEPKTKAKKGAAKKGKKKAHEAEEEEEEESD